MDGSLHELHHDTMYIVLLFATGHLRLTWNSMGIQEFIERGNQQISALISKIRQIEILRVQLQEIVNYVEAKKLLEWEHQ